MKNKLLTYAIFLLSIFLWLKGNAQNSCGSDLIYQYRMKTDSVFRNDNLELESQIKEIIQNQERGPVNSFLQSPIYNIPVVVHVIHKGETLGTGTNISDAQIIGAIQGLNARFRNTNAAGVDMQLNFQLAVRDSNGNTTTGINRVNGTSVTNYATGGINNIFYSSCGDEHALKDLSRWPIKNYLNIWVVYRICAGNISGIATLQTGSPYDGICIVYSLMTQSDITLSHEVGHMFNLLHTFQGDGGSVTTSTTLVCPPDTCCVDRGDRVCDTPPHKQNDTDATNPCTSAGVWANSRYNIMSYNWNTLPAIINTSNVRFTQGQKDRGRAAMLATGYQPYINSNGLIPVTVRDAGIESIIYPLKTMYTTNCNFPNALIPIVKLKNYGSNTLTSVTIKYKLDAGTLNTFSWSGSLLTDSFINVTLPAVSTSQGAHTFLAYTTNPNGLADGYGLNDSADWNFNYNAPQTFSLNGSATNATTFGGSNGAAIVTAIPKIEIKEDWEGTIDWTIENSSQLNKWVIGTATPNGGTKSIYISKDGTTNTYDTFTSAVSHFYKDFYFPNGATNIKIKYDWKGMGQFFSGFGCVDGLKIYMVSTSTPVTTLVELSNPYLRSNCSQSTYITDSIMGLDSVAGTSKRLVFSWRNNLYYGTQSPAAVDNVSVSYNLPSTPTYTYSWNTTPVQSTATATGLSAGTYIATVTDSNGCVNNKSFIITQPTPVNLLSFDASVYGKDVLLIWKTGSEINNQRFEVERSEDNDLINNGQMNQANWLLAGTVKGAGNSNSIRNYSITDVNVFTKNTIEYYRLKQIDFNGASTYSTILKVMNTDITSSVIIYPNPSSGKITVEMDNAKGKLDKGIIEIYNLIGEKVFQSELTNIQNGSSISKTEINLNLSNGVYYYRVKNIGQSVSSGKLFIQ